MSRFGHLVLVFTLALAVGIGRAQAPSAAGPGEGCRNASTTAAMRACENARYQAADQRLNEVYAQLMKDLDAGRREKLRAAERVWLQFRDANAEFLGSAAAGGTLEPLLRITALADMTEARAAELAKVKVR